MGVKPSRPMRTPSRPSCLTGASATAARPFSACCCGDAAAFGAGCCAAGGVNDPPRFCIVRHTASII
eukprot:2949563-Prymnesium_polylepis.1